MMPELPRLCEVRDLGRLRYQAAWDLQKQLVEARKKNEISDQLLFVEHPHVITMGRNGKVENLLAGADVLEKTGIDYVQINRGGDVTYHGPGQIVGYPILDLREWKRDVVAYVRALEQVMIDALVDLGVPAERSGGCTGVWVGDAKIAAIGIHISRWVTSHGFALNVDNELSYFRYIVPCGLTRPVTSLRELGCTASREQVIERLKVHFAEQFFCRVEEPVLIEET